jgi:DNA mismatch repair protein MutS2
VVEVRDARATVEANGLRLDVRVSDLELEPERSGRGESGGGGRRARRARARSAASSPGGGWSGPSFEASPEVHLRGLRAEEVEGKLYPALDAAVQAGLASLRVVHGKGTGVLREVVVELLERDPRVLSHRPGGLGEGGGGVTVAELA